jgi:hypothetical protein
MTARDAEKLVEEIVADLAEIKRVEGIVADLTELRASLAEQFSALKGEPQARVRHAEARISDP